MFDVTKTNARRIAVALVGTAIFSTTALFAAVGPARAAAPDAMSAWQAKVEGRLVDKMIGIHQPLQGDRYAIGTVLVDIDGAGRVLDAQMLRSTGSATLDRQALHRARAVKFPATPSGKAAHVQMNLLFGHSQHAVDLARAELGRQTTYASKGVDRSSNGAGRAARGAGM